MASAVTLLFPGGEKHVSASNPGHDFFQQKGQRGLLALYSLIARDVFTGWRGGTGRDTTRAGQHPAILEAFSFSSISK